MSDEVMTTCQQCGRLMVAPGGYLCDHARYWPDRASLESQNQALQEALKEAAMTVHLKHPHAGLTIGPFDSCEHALCTRYRNALSPTQETDPE